MSKFILALTFVMCAPLFAAQFQIPALTGPVVDTAGLLSPDTAAQISSYLRGIYEAGGSQIQVAIVPDLGGVAIEEASIKLAEAWKIGRGGKDNGVILLIAVTDHKLRIEVGKGREGDLPDLTANRIIREIIVPYMRQNDPNRAVMAGVQAIVHNTDPTLAGEPVVQEPVARPARRAHPGMHFLFILFFFILLQFLFRGGGRGGGGFWYGGGGGGWGGGSSGGGGWSGGGGGFSGGGSSGSW